jgi:fimbrial chaperone protein
MKPDNLKSELKVINNGTEEVSVQITAFKWSQDEMGEDQYEPTNDVIFFPKMVTIEKGKERIIRVGFRGGKINVKEETYRLFVEEIPGMAKSEESKLVFALKFGIPIFITPDKQLKEVVENVEVSEGVVSLTIINKGNIHFVAEMIRIRGVDKEGNELYKKEIRGWYNLHGISRIYKISLSEKECPDTALLHLNIESKDKPSEHTVKISENSCNKPTSLPLPQ